MIHLHDFIDFSNLSLQYFSLPKPLINYISNNSYIVLSQKLMKCCKTLKLLHLKSNQSQMKNFNIQYLTKHYFDLETCVVEKGEFNSKPLEQPLFEPEIVITVKLIKILNALILYWVTSKKFSNLLPKFDLSLTKKLLLLINAPLKFEWMEKLYGPSLIDIEMYVLGYEGNVNPALLAMQKCQKMKTLEIDLCQDNILISKNNIKEMIHCKNVVITKLKNCCFTFVDEKIDQNNLIEFVDKYLQDGGCISYVFRSGDNDDYRNIGGYLAKIEQLRRNKGDTKFKIGIRHRIEGLKIYDV